MSRLISLYEKIFFGISGVYLLLILFNQENSACYLKPFLILSLFLMVTQLQFSHQKIVLTALSFSWLGDVVLIFSEKNALYFIIGLVAFLIAHLTYIYLFIQQKPKINVLKNKHFWLGVVLAVVYLISLLNYLFPRLGELKIPVLIYASTISIMAIVSYKGFLTWAKPMNQMVFFGAICFVISDSLLAVNKFATPLPLASFWIMSTYLLAQYFIVKGILKMNENSVI